MPNEIDKAIAPLGDTPLTEAALRQHIDPLFSKVLHASLEKIYLANRLCTARTTSSML